MTTHPHSLPAGALVGAVVWLTSSYSSGSGNNCVEVADLTHTVHGAVAIRDSKNADGPALLFQPAPFAAFLRNTRNNAHLS